MHAASLGEVNLLRVCKTLYNQTKTVDGGRVC